jgi:DNA-binding LacI/PurR family transcriptional regulator
MPKIKSFPALDREGSTPVYRQIEDQLRRKILSGELAAGVCLPKGQELSRQFGVAYRTVVRSLEALKKEGLLRGVPSRGTFVQMRSRRQLQNIAITFDQNYQLGLARDLERFQRGILQACHDSDFQLQLFPLRGAIFSKDEPTLLAKLIEEGHIHGVITFSAVAPEDIDRLVKLGVPTVTSRDVYPDTGVPWVMEDLDDAARQMLRFLVAGLGHRRLGLVMGARPGVNTRVVRPSGLLAESLQREMEAMGMEARPDRIVYSDFLAEKALPAVREWLRTADRPTALICIDPAIGQAILQMAREEFGLTAPRNLSLLSYGDIWPAASMTVARFPVERMTERAVEYLEQLARGENPTPVPLPVELVIRQTCGPAPTEQADSFEQAGF